MLLGIPLVLWFTAGVALLVRQAVKTELGSFSFHAARLEVTWVHWAAWGEWCAAGAACSRHAAGRRKGGQLYLCCCCFLWPHSQLV